MGEGQPLAKRRRTDAADDAEAVTLHVSALALSAQSDVFRQLLSSSMLEQAQKTIKLVVEPQVCRSGYCDSVWVFKRLAGIC